MKYLGKLFATALVSLLAMGNVAQAQDMTFFRIGTGGAGGTYFPIGGLIANAISSPPGARSCEKGGTCGVPGLIAIAVSTNASVFNMNAVQAGNLEAGLAGGQSVAQGYEGTGKFKGDKKDKVRIIANLYPEDMHLVLPKGTKMSSLKELEGKSVGVASAGSGTQVSVKMILKHYGISVKENELGLKQSAQRLADELQSTRAGWEACPTDAQATMAFNEDALTPARSELTAGTEASSAPITEIAVLERALLEVRNEVVRAHAAVGRDDGGESACAESHIQSLGQESQLPAALRGWESSWHQASMRAESSAGARELAEDIHPQLLDARAKYTDYVEPVAEEVVATGDDGWD